MFDFLESLRNKSEHSRRMIALSISLSITLVIGVVWGTISFSGNNSEQTVARVQQKSTTPSPFAAMKENTIRTFQGIKEQFTSINMVFQATTSPSTLEGGLAAPAAVDFYGETEQETVVN